jgi:hypothetical protein
MNTEINEEHTTFTKTYAINEYMKEKEKNTKYWNDFIVASLSPTPEDKLYEVDVIDKLYDKLTSEATGVGLMYSNQNILSTFKAKCILYHSNGKWPNACIYYKRIFGRDIDEEKEV